PFAAEDLRHRLAPQPPPHQLAEAPSGGGRQLAIRLGDQPRPPHPHRLGEQQFRVQARLLHPRRPQPVDRRRERLPEPPCLRPAGPAHAAAAARRRRFSSAERASVNSSSSPPSTPSRLCEVSLIRWSVTRPWGKL